LLLLLTIMADQKDANRWLDETESKHPVLLQSSRKTRFRDVVHRYQSFQKVLKAIAPSDGGRDQNTAKKAAHKLNDNVDKRDTVPTVTEIPEDVDNLSAFLHAVTILGCCETVETLLHNKTAGIDVDGTDDDGITALHLATLQGNYKNVKVLLDAGAKVKTDVKDVTPLHVAAASVEPDPEIVKLLIQKTKDQNTENGVRELVNKQTKEGGMTALHIAAGNNDVSFEFIEALKSTDFTIKDNKHETAFHVAAKADNPDAIVAMLNVFTPAEKAWKMEDIECGDTDEGTLLEICAKRGNAKAVAVLIKYGADISEKVLFQLIDESVNNPTATDKLISVYHTITENCVLWDWLKQKHEERCQNHYPSKGTKTYKQKQREIMLKLITESVSENVLEHAIRTGAKAFLRELVNTPNVLKLTPEIENVVTYNITNFLTLREKRRWLQFRFVRRRTATVRPEIESQTPDTTARPTRSYLDQITDSSTGDLWIDTDILQEEPFLTVTHPVCALVKLVNVVLTLIQLCYMICFSIYHMPTYCSLNEVFEIHVKDFNVSVQCKSSGFVIDAEFISSHRPHWLWLAWAVVTYVPFAFFILKRMNLSSYFISPNFPFLISVIVWFSLSSSSSDFNAYLTSTSFVHLFGWLYTLSLFICTSKKLCVFLFLVKEIIVKDIIFSFGVVFVFLLLSFSSAIHVLRNSALRGEKTYADTVYNLFASALTTGNFIDETYEDTSHDNKDSFHLTQLRITFAMYLCCATIVLLNILISMMNNRYNEAVRKAKNVWQFYMVSTGIHFMRWLPVSIPFSLVNISIDGTIEEKDELLYLKLPLKQKSDENMTLKIGPTCKIY